MLDSLLPQRAATAWLKDALGRCGKFRELARRTPRASNELTTAFRTLPSKHSASA